MKKRIRLGIIGAGAVGASLGDAMSKILGADLAFVATGERAERLRKGGVRINGRQWMPRIIGDQDDVVADVLLVLVKNYSLTSALVDMAACIDEKTVIVSLLNGVTAVDEIKRAFPNNKVLYGIVMRTDANRTSGQITYSTLGEIQFGEAENVYLSDDVKKVARIFDTCGINYHVYEDMVRMLWRKWMVNIGANQVSLLTAAKFKYFRQFPEISHALDLAMQEMVDIAKKKEIHITTKDKEDMIEVLLNYPPEKKTSMLQDLEAGRQTEIDYFAGTVVKFGRECGVPTPVNETMWCLVKAREKVNMIERA